ncbi:DUF4363 family protein [Clostridium ljungdahlii]|uniref:DUF4363 family protein n=1 Tax=Clostridium ljungdahlii TaxID=1538 RepID=UPI00386B25C5
MRNFLVKTIPIVTLILFVLVMISDNFLKKPLTKNDNVPKCIQLVMEDVKNNKWDDAYRKSDQLSNAWKKVVTRVQFSAEKDEIDSFTMNVARLQVQLPQETKQMHLWSSMKPMSTGITLVGSNFSLHQEFHYKKTFICYILLKYIFFASIVH